MSYIASHTFFGKASTFGSKLSLATAIDEAVSNYNWRLTAMAPRHVQLNLTRLCMGSREAWGLFKDAGDTRKVFKYEGDSMHCMLSNYRFTLETGSIEAFFPAVREAMYREYLRLMCECGQPECTSIGL